MGLRPLGHRILVKPDEQETQTDSGLVLPGDRHYVPTSGIVVAVGDGPARDATIRASAISKCIAIVEELADCHDWDTHDTMVTSIIDEMRRYRNQTEQIESLGVGDRVVYPVESGLELKQDGQTYILLNEDDAVVIATEEEQAA